MIPLRCFDVPVRRFVVGALALLATLPAAATPASQKPPKPDPKKPVVERKQAAPRLEPFLGTLAEAKAHARERNAPLIVHLVLDGEQDNDNYRTKVLPDTDLVAASVRAVVIVANNGTHAKKTRDEVQPDGTTAKREVCTAFDTPTCGAHQRCWDDLYRDYHDDEGGLRCPQTIVLAPDGKLAWRSEAGHVPDVGVLIEELQKAIDTAGPGVTDAQLVQVRKLADEGGALMAAQSWPAAIQTWNALLAITPKGSWATPALEGLPVAQKALAAEVERLAALLVPGTAAQGFQGLQALAKACAGLPLEKDLAARLKKAETDKSIAAEIAAWKLGVEADALLGEAQKFADAGDEKKARATARKLMAKRYAGTSAAETARKLWPEVAAETK